MSQHSEPAIARGLQSLASLARAITGPRSAKIWNMVEYGDRSNIPQYSDNIL